MSKSSGTMSNAPSSGSKPSLSPMGFAAQAFDQVCGDVENAITIDDRLKQLFADSQEELQYRVDKRIAFDRWIKIQKAAAEEGIAYYQDLLARLESVHEKFKAQTKADVEAVPNVEFRGKLGKIWVQKNNPRIEYSFGDKRVSKEVIEMFGVPDEYVIAREIPATVEYSIDSARLMADLKAGKEFPWATLKQGSHVRFPAERKNKIDGSKGEPKQIEENP